MYFKALWDERINQEPKNDLISMMAHSPATRDMPFLEFLGNLGEHDAIERPHGAADLRHQHGAEHVERRRQRLVLALQALRGHAEALGHVDAVIAIADLTVDLAEIGPVFDDALGHCQDDVAGRCVVECLHACVPLRAASCT